MPGRMSTEHPSMFAGLYQLADDMPCEHGVSGSSPESSTTSAVQLQSIDARAKPGLFS